MMSLNAHMSGGNTYCCQTIVRKCIHGTYYLSTIFSASRACITANSDLPGNQPRCEYIDRCFYHGTLFCQW